MRKLWFIILIVISSGTLHALSPERILFDEAESRYNKGELDFALKRYKDLLQDYPLSLYVPDAQFRIAVITLRSGKLAEAELLFDRIENRYMNTRFAAYLPFWRGLIKFRQGMWDSASAFFSVFLAGNPGSLYREANLYYAKSEHLAGRTASAVEILDRWFSRNKGIYDDPYLITFYLSLLEKIGRYDDVALKSRGITPGMFDQEWLDRINLIRAESLYKTGYPDEAAVLYQEVLGAAPDIASVAFIRLFTIYHDDTDRQRAVFDKAQIQLSGSPVLLNEFLLRVGIDSYKNGHFEIAASYLQRIWRTSEISKVNSLVPVYLAKMYVREGDRREAAEILTAYNSTSTVTDELVLYTLSNVLVEDKKWTEAELNLKNFLISFPESDYYSSAAWMYAYTLYMSGQYQAGASFIDSVLSDGRGGAFTNDFILLSARIYVKLDKLPKALAMFKEYLPFDNQNPEIWFEIIKLQFNQGNFENVADTFNKLVTSGIINSEDPYSLLIEYIAGLASVADGRYEDGLDYFSKISPESLEKHSLGSVFPYIAYYSGWASYRLSLYENSYKWFELISRDYPDSSVYSDALYFSGWSLYLLERYPEAARFFADFSSLSTGPDKVKGLFFYGKSLYGADSLNEAEVIFQNIYTEYKDSPYADDSLFEHGQILEKLGKPMLAVSAYRELYKRYPTSSLGEESLFRIGEIYFRSQDYSEAGDAFYFQRLKFPKGTLGDVSLYWGAEADEKLGEIFGAILLLEKLLDEYPESNFRAKATQKIAEFYAGEGEYRKALAFYSEYLTSYSDSDNIKEIREQIQKLNLLQSGVASMEADLLVIIDNNDLDSEESREAHIELARIYLYKYNDREEKAFDLLSNIAVLKDQYPVSASRALYYLGEYYSLGKDYSMAAKSFLDAATVNPGNRDLAGMSLLRATEMAIAAGDINSAERMVRLLESNFPASEWLKEGRSALERAK